ncbi:MAG: hypothetical protein KC493_16905 [Bacteriovoracaceae bacterium]|nr:hypothetical protein [Bacteriovoracaceae bacterium]
MQILIFEEKKELLDLLAMNLKMNNGIEVIPKLFISEGKGFVDILPEIKLIVINNSTEFDARLDLIDYVLKEKEDIEMIVVSGTIKTEHPRLMLIDRINDPEELLGLVTKKFSEDFLSQEESAYSPVSLNNLSYFKKLPVDIFLKLKDRDNQKFLKVLNSGDSLPEDFIQKYNDKSVAEVFIAKSNKDEFSKEISKLFLEYFKAKSQKENVTFESFEEIHQKSFEQMTDIGFSPMSTKLAMESVGDLMGTLEKRKDFKVLLNHVYKTDAPYSYRFSYMTSLIAHALVKKFPWCSESNLQTIMYAAMFSDIGLTDNHLRLRTDEKLKKSIMGKEDKEMLKKHAFENGNKLKNVKGIPAEVSKTIIQHHGAHNGLGFPQNISAQVTPIALCLIVSQEFVHFILNGDNKINVNEAIDHINERFVSIKLEPVLSALKKCILKP